MAGKVRKWGEAAIRRSYPLQSLISWTAVPGVEGHTFWFLCMVVWIAFAWVKASKEKACVAQPGTHRSLGSGISAHGRHKEHFYL